MRIQLSADDYLFVTDLKNIYKMNQINNSKPKKKQKTQKKTNKNDIIYKPKISKIESKKLIHRTRAKKKLSPFYKCSVVAATKIDENFQIGPENNLFYVCISTSLCIHSTHNTTQHNLLKMMGVGFFKEAIFVLRRNTNYHPTDKKSNEYLKPRRVHTFGSGEGNRICSVNPIKFHKEKKDKYVTLHCRALGKFFRMRYCVKTNDLKIETWNIAPDFLRIQWLLSYPFNNNLCVGLVVEWSIHMVILYGFLCYTGMKSVVSFEIFRFNLRQFDEKEKGRQHHCYCMCYMKKMNKICVVVEGECFLIYHDENIVSDEDMNDCENKLIQLQSSWNKYNIGMLVQKDDVEGTEYFYPKSIAQFRDTNFVIGVNGTNVSAMFQIM